LQRWHKGLNFDSNSYQTNPLIRACQNGHFHIAEYLIGNGAELDSSNSKQSISALYWATKQQNVALCRLLLENGANPNGANHRNITPLAYAASKNNLGICKMLLENNADASIKSLDGKDAMDSTNSQAIIDLIKYHRRARSITASSTRSSGRRSSVSSVADGIYHILNISSIAAIATSSSHNSSAG
jgi:ankyrin repeat protein